MIWETILTQKWLNLGNHPNLSRPPAPLYRFENNNNLGIFLLICFYPQLMVQVYIFKSFLKFDFKKGWKIDPLPSNHHFQT